MSVCKINECGFESIVLFDWTKLNTSVKIQIFSTTIQISMVRYEILTTKKSSSTISLGSTTSLGAVKSVSSLEIFSVIGIKDNQEG